MTPHPSLRTISAVLDDVQRTTKGRPKHWVVVNDIASRLHLENEVVEAAARFAVNKGYLVASGTPTHSVSLRTSAT